MVQGVRIEGLDSLTKLFPELKEQIINETKLAVAASALLIQNEAKDSMRKSKGGKTYRRGSIKRKRKGQNVVVGSKFHRASAPGEPPAVDTGRLIASINHKITNKGLTATIGVHDITKVKYGKFLEYGTARIKARPWLFPALEKKRKDIEKRISEGIKRAMRVKV